MKDKLILSDKEVNYFLRAVTFMLDVTEGDITQVDYFTDEEIKGFTVMCKFLSPLVQKIHEEKLKGVVNNYGQT